MQTITMGGYFDGTLGSDPVRQRLSAPWFRLIDLKPRGSNSEGRCKDFFDAIKGRVALQRERKKTYVGARLAARLPDRVSMALVSFGESRKNEEPYWR